MASCAAIDNRRTGRLPIGPQTTSLPHIPRVFMNFGGPPRPMKAGWKPAPRGPCYHKSRVQSQGIPMYPSGVIRLLVLLSCTCALFAQGIPSIGSVVNAASQDNRLSPACLADIVGSNWGRTESASVLIGGQDARHRRFWPPPPDRECGFGFRPAGPDHHPTRPLPDLPHHPDSVFAGAL